MNNLFKRLFKNKKTVLIVSIIVLILIASLAFFLNRERANSLFDRETITGTEDNIKLTTFSSYEILNDKVINLFKDSNNTFLFVDEEDNILYRTQDNIEYFRVFKDNSIVYLTSSLNTSTNKMLMEVKLVDLNTQTSTILHAGEKLFLDISTDYIYIVDGLSGNVLYGTDNNLYSYSLKTPISKVISNKGKVFAVNYTAINGTVRSTIYLLLDGKPEEVAVCEGKVQSISVDYANDNLIYFSSNLLHSNRQSDLVVYSKYLIDLSATSDDVTTYTNLNHNIISIKDKYLTIDKDTNTLVLLNNNFTKSKTLGYLHENMINSLLKESISGDSLYYINKSGHLTKI